MRRLIFSFLVAGVLLLAAEVITTKSGLKYEVTAEGRGPQAKAGDHVRIHETMGLADGTVIFTTRTKGAPIQFLLGGNQAIAGLDEGVTGMRAGERRKMIIPPSLSKRSSYPPNTPPDAVLHYDVELVEIVKK
jgi:peptidylprolyl isomerase